MLRPTLVAMVAVAMLATAANADVYYGVWMFDNGAGTGARDAAGDTMAEGDGTWVLAIDLDGDGWDGLDYTEQATSEDNYSSWLWDAEDWILGRGPVADSSAGMFAGEIFAEGTMTSAEIDGLTDGRSYDKDVDAYYILWFDVAYDAGAAGPGENVAYGAEYCNTLVGDGFNGDAFPVGGNANLTTTPEPATLALMLLGGGLVALRRRRHA